MVRSESKQAGEFLTGEEAESDAAREAALGPWAIVAYVAAVAILILRVSGNDIMDDAFITYNYARSLAEGDGFVYSARYATWGTTTPLFTLMLAALHFVWVPLPLAARLIDVGAMALQWAIFWRVAGMLGIERWRPAIILFWAALYLYPTTFPGMEYGLFAALSVGAVVLAIDDSWTPAAFTAALATVMRPDGALVALIVGVMFLMHTRLRRGLVPFSLALCVLPLAWYGFSYLYFGRLWPQTLEMRRIEAESFGIFGLGWMDYFLNYEYYYSYLYAIIWGLLVASLKNPRFIWLFIYLCGYVGMYTAFGIPEYMIYFAPIFLVSIVFGAVALPLTLATEEFSAPMHRTLAAVLFIVLATNPVVDSAYWLWALAVKADPTDQYRSIYTPLAEELARPEFDELDVAMAEIGVMGFHLRDRLIEIGGLVNDEAVPYYVNDAMDKYIDRLEPAILILGEDFGANLFLSGVGLHGYARAHYVHLTVLIATNNKRFDLFAREDIVRDYGLRPSPFYGNHRLGRLFARGNVKNVYPNIPPARSIDIGGGLDEHFLTGGWWRAEEWAERTIRWTQMRAELRFSLSEVAAAETEGLRVTLFPFPEADRPLWHETLEVLLNGTPISRVQIQSNAFNEVLIPASIPAGDNVLTIVNPDTDSEGRRNTVWHHFAVDRIDFLRELPRKP